MDRPTGAENVNTFLLRYNSALKLWHVYSDLTVYYCDCLTGAPRWQSVDVDSEEQFPDSDSSTGNKQQWQQQKCLDLLTQNLQVHISCMVFVMETLLLHWGNINIYIWITDNLIDISEGRRHSHCMHYYSPDISHNRTFRCSMPYSVQKSVASFPCKPVQGVDVSGQIYLLQLLWWVLH